MRVTSLARYGLAGRRRPAYDLRRYVEGDLAALVGNAINLRIISRLTSANEL